MKSRFQSRLEEMEAMKKSLADGVKPESNKIKKEYNLRLFLSIVLTVSSVLAFLIWEQLREFEKIAFIVSLSGIALILVISLFIDVYYMLESIFDIYKSRKETPLKELTEQAIIKRDYKKLTELRRLLKSQLIEVDKTLKKIDSQQGQNYSNKPYSGNI